MTEVNQPDGEHVTLISNGHRWRIPLDAADSHRLTAWSCDNCGTTVSPSDPATPCQGQDTHD